MKTILLTAALVLGTLVPAQAQNAKSCAHDHASASASGTATEADASAKGKAMASVLTAELGLDEKQALRVEQALVSAEEKAVALRGKEKGKDSLEKLSDGTFRSVRGMLTAEQGKKLDDLKAAGKWTVASASTGKGCCAGGGHAAEGNKPGCCQGKGAKADAGAAPVQ